MLAHLGASKMLDYLRDQVWWKDMVSDTKSFCETCVTCKQSKPSNQKPYTPYPFPVTLGNQLELILLDHCRNLAIEMGHLTQLLWLYAY